MPVLHGEGDIQSRYSGTLFTGVAARPARAEKNRKVALIAVCNKLLKQAFAIAKSGAVYQPN